MTELMKARDKMEGKRGGEGGARRRESLPIWDSPVVVEKREDTSTRQPEEKGRD